MEGFCGLIAFLLSLALASKKNHAQNGYKASRVGQSGCRDIVSGRVGLNYTHNITQIHSSLVVIDARGCSVMVKAPKNISYYL